METSLLTGTSQQEAIPADPVRKAVESGDEEDSGQSQSKRKTKEVEPAVVKKRFRLEKEEPIRIQTPEIVDMVDADADEVSVADEVSNESAASSSDEGSRESTSESEPELSEEESEPELSEEDAAVATKKKKTKPKSNKRAIVDDDDDASEEDAAVAKKKKKTKPKSNKMAVVDDDDDASDEDAVATKKKKKTKPKSNKMAVVDDGDDAPVGKKKKKKKTPLTEEEKLEKLKLKKLNHFNKLWKKPKDNKGGHMYYGTSKYDTRVSVILRRIAKSNGIQIIQLRDRTGLEENVRKKSVTAADGNKFLHNDMKM